jgi:hypothetical protein
MPVRYTDAEIQALIAEPKPLSGRSFAPIRWVQREGHRKATFDVMGDNGNAFVIILRQSLFNDLDFSVILGTPMPGTTTLFILRRYNGRSHQHRNKIEKTRFQGFHIHTATERYQEADYDEEGYAEPTDRYDSFAGALRCLLDDAGFYDPTPPEPSLFSSTP